jgi:hypothetical protein
VCGDDRNGDGNQGENECDPAVPGDELMLQLIGEPPPGTLK